MNPLGLTRFIARILLTIFTWGGTKITCGQNFLYVEHSGQARMVRDFAGECPQVEVDGKLVPADSHKLFLKKNEEYAPFSISVQSLDVSYSYQEFVGDVFDDKLTIRSRFETPYDLAHVFFVLEFPRALTGRKIFAGEIGELFSYQEKSTTTSLELNPAEPFRVYSSGARPDAYVHARPETEFVLHIFTDGFELFHSRIPPDVVNKNLDQMVARRTRGVEKGAAKKLVGPIPRYPPDFRARGVAGDAILAFEISASGRVVDAHIKSATRPEFGDAAMQAISQWRFLPKVENGRPVASKAELPFDFAPPKS